MIKRSHRIYLIVMLQFFCLPLSASETLNDVTEAFEQFFQQLVAERGYPGAAFAIVQREQVLAIGTYGHTDTSKSREIDPQTAFRLASVSKTFAAQAVSLLVTDGAVQWQDPVIRYVPDFKVAGDTSQIQIQHLLGQSTGLIPHAYDNLLEHGKNMETIWKRMSDLSYLCAPGTCYGYQNSIFSLVDPVVEQVTAKSYETLVEERIFKPLGMQNATLGYESFINNPNHAKPHARSRGQWKTVSVKPNYYHAAPAAGVNASIQDMGKWVQAQLGSQPAVLPPESTSRLHEPRVKTRRELHRRQWRDLLSDAHYGLGWRVYQLGSERLIYHGGWVSGFRADVAFSPGRNLGIVVLMNAESGGISELTTRFWEMALAL